MHSSIHISPNAAGVVSLENFGYCLNIKSMCEEEKQSATQLEFIANTVLVVLKYNGC